MSSSGEAGGLKELAKSSMCSRNLAWGIPRAFLPSVMDSREMLATGDSSSSLVDDIVWMDWPLFDLPTQCLALLDEAMVS